MVSKLPQYFIVKERIDCPNDKKPLIHKKLFQLTKEYKRLTLDGVKIFFDDGSVLIRPSGTESVYRVYAEAKNKARSIEIANWATSLVKKFLKKH
jgi:phosphomannomutase/phosphoglucomutase